jgi:hypothetical protein
MGSNRDKNRGNRTKMKRKSLFIQIQKMEGEWENLSIEKIVWLKIAKWNQSKNRIWIDSSRVEYHTVQIQTEQNRIQLSEILRRKKEKLAHDLYKFKDEMKWKKDFDRIE